MTRRWTTVLAACVSVAGCGDTHRLTLRSAAGLEPALNALRHAGFEAERSTGASIELPAADPQVAEALLRRLGLWEVPPTEPRRLVMGPTEARIEARSRVAAALVGQLRARDGVLNAVALVGESSGTITVFAPAPPSPGEIAEVRRLAEGALGTGCTLAIEVVALPPGDAPPRAAVGSPLVVLLAVLCGLLSATLLIVVRRLPRTAGIRRG